MTYKQYLKGNLDGFRQMNDLQVADLGACEDGARYVKNLDDFYDLAKQVASYIYELDNDKYENTQAHSDECA